MELSALAGNPRLKELLSQREEGRGLSHAYIISGPAGSGRHTLARLLTGAMVCSAARRAAMKLASWVLAPRWGSMTSATSAMLLGPAESFG